MKLIKPSFIIKEQESGLIGIYRQIEYAGRICYRSSDKITEDSAKPFVDRMIKSGHGAMLEHGAVYLKLTPSEIHIYHKYKNNPYTKVNVVNSEDPYPVPTYYISTNYRVLVEHDWMDDLKYICEPTEYHEKRITVRFILSRSIAQEYTRHRVFSFAMESQRYCAYNRDKFGNEVTFIIPCWFENRDNILGKWDGFKLGQWESIEENVKPKLFYEPYSVEDMYERIWILNCIQSEENYKMLLTDHKIETDRGPWTPQQAREVLPNACKTELIMTGFVSDWKDFFYLRCAPSAHPQARELAIPLEEEFKSLNLI